MKTKRPNQKNEVMLRVVDYFGSQAELAKILGVSQQFVSKLVNNKSSVPLREAMKIEKLTKRKITLKMLMSEKDKCYLKNN